MVIKEYELLSSVPKLRMEGREGKRRREEVRGKGRKGREEIGREGREVNEREGKKRKRRGKGEKEK
jgi:hypothetical protein